MQVACRGGRARDGITYLRSWPLDGIKKYRLGIRERLPHEGTSQAQLRVRVEPADQCGEWLLIRFRHDRLQKREQVCDGR